MNNSQEKFYDLFWKHKACQNLFLLSKEEFLDTKTFTFGEKPINVSFPRIILSNVESKNDYNHSKIKIRTDNHVTKSELFLQQTFDKYEPLITAFLESKFRGISERIINDFSKDPAAFLFPIILAFISSQEDGEKHIMSLLHKYNIVRNNIATFQQLGEYVEKEAVSKNIKAILSEQNLWAFLEFMKTLKDRYVSEVYKSLHNSNQVLVSSYHDIDNFTDRLKLFSMLYDSEIIKPSTEDSFLECTNCPPDTYRGVFNLKINPLNLKKIKCPLCNSPITFYVPYELDAIIYNLVKEQDGTILKALENLLKRNKIKHKLNIKELNDIELDCVYRLKKETYFVECKMYKQNTTQNKLESKIKEHYIKLIKDIERVLKHKNTPIETTHPILLVNINDKNLLNSIIKTLKEKNSGELYQRGKILTINQIPFK
jgi:hypothetical protein